MKHYFIINPASGQGNMTEKLIADIENAANELSLDVSIYLTKDVLDGERAAREFAQSVNGEAARIYACGGDGTISEVVNGAVGYDNIHVGFIPIGTGNDLVRNFPEAGDFRNIKAQLEGFDSAMDLIEYSGVIDGKQTSRYCANMINIGLDCNVAELASRLKKKPLIAGSMAYLLAVGIMFIKKQTIGLRVTSGDEVLVDDDILLCAIANGSYCGGGVYSSPQSILDDGEFDINIVNNISHLDFLNLFPKYQKGTHLEMKGIDKYIKITKGNNIDLQCKTGEFFLCADGEILVCSNVHFEIAPKALKIVLPAKQ